TPSPWWARRAMVSRSITRCPDEEFAISVASGNRRCNDTGDAPSQRLDQRANVLAHATPDHGVANDAFFQVTPAHLELRLDQDDGAGWRARQRERFFHHEPERDEAHVNHDEGRRLR